MRLAVWGISETLKEIEKHPYYLNEKNIIAYIDSDQKWMGKMYKGKQVMLPEDAVIRQDGYDAILICSAKYQDAILKQSRKLGLDYKVLPLEMIYPFIEIHFNAVLKQFLESDTLKIVKNWYVEGTSRSIILSIGKLKRRTLKLHLFPKWCLGTRRVDMHYTITNLQNGEIEADGDYDIDEDIDLEIKYNPFVLKITTSGLNSSFITVSDRNVIEEEEPEIRVTLQQERAYNNDFIWHEFDYEFITHMIWNDNYTILDIGANLGQSSENFLRHTRADVVAVEANPAYRIILEELENDNSDRFKFISGGVAGGTGRLTFYIPKFEADVAQESSFDRKRVEMRIKKALDNMK